MLIFNELQSGSCKNKKARKPAAKHTHARARGTVFALLYTHTKNRNYLRYSDFCVYKRVLCRSHPHFCHTPL